MNNYRYRRQPLVRRLLGGSDYVWIKCLVGNKYVILGPYRNEEEAGNSVASDLQGVAYDIFHLKTKDKGEASKALKDATIGKGMSKHDDMRSGHKEHGDGVSRIHFV